MSKDTGSVTSGVGVDSTRQDPSPPLVAPCEPDSLDGFFDRFAKWVTRFAGSPVMFGIGGAGGSRLGLVRSLF